MSNQSTEKCGYCNGTGTVEQREYCGTVYTQCYFCKGDGAQSEHEREQGIRTRHYDRAVMVMRSLNDNVLKPRPHCKGPAKWFNDSLTELGIECQPCGYVTRYIVEKVVDTTLNITI